MIKKKKDPGAVGSPLNPNKNVQKKERVNSLPRQDLEFCRQEGGGDNISILARRKGAQQGG